MIKYGKNHACRDFPNLSLQNAQLDKILFVGFYAHKVGNGCFKAPFSFLGLQKLNIKHEHLDKFRSLTKLCQRLGNDKMDVAGSVGGLCSYCRCKNNSDIHFDGKLYFSLSTFIGSIIGKIVSVSV